MVHNYLVQNIAATLRDLGQFGGGGGSKPPLDGIFFYLDGKTRHLPHQCNSAITNIKLYGCT